MGKEADMKEDSATVSKWSNDWLSVLGVNKGLTGLTKDFVMNYLGRSAYHDRNGPLINAINAVSDGLPGGDNPVTMEHTKGFRLKLLDVCAEGKKVFESGGSLYTMLDELEVI